VKDSGPVPDGGRQRWAGVGRLRGLRTTTDKGAPSPHSVRYVPAQPTLGWGRRRLSVDKYAEGGPFLRLRPGPAVPLLGVYGPSPSWGCTKRATGPTLGLHVVLAGISREETGALGVTAVGVPGLGEEYREIFGGLRGFFGSRGVPPDEASDLAQESITRALLHIKRHGVTTDDLWPLLRTIARNLYVERGRRARPNLVPLSDATSVTDDVPTPDEIAVSGERRRIVRGALSSLPARQRRVVELSMHGLSPAEIARELGIKRNAADALIHRARRSLASHLRSEGFAMPSVFGLTLLRARLALRRLAASVARFDGAGSLAVGASGLAAAGIAAIIAVGGLSGGVAGRAASTSDGTHIAAMRAVAGDAPGSARRTSVGAKTTGSPSAAGLVADLNDQRVGAHADAENPTNPGDNNLLQVDVWHRRDPGHRGFVGPVLDGVTINGCTGPAC